MSLFANAHRSTVVDFGPNPRNPARGVARDAWLRLNGFLVDVIAGGDVDPGNQFTGDGPALQDFRGAANPASTTVVYHDGGVPTISSAIAQGPETDPVRRILADRLRRRSAL